MKKTTILLALIGFYFSVEAQRPYLSAALRAEQWLRSVRMDTEAGYYWRPDPQDSTSFATNLYSGSAGVVLFYLELYLATTDTTYLEQAKGGANFLIQNLPDTIPAAQALGLYTGLAGVGFAFYQTYRLSGEKLYLEGAQWCNELLYRSAQPAGKGIEWGGLTDIVYGSAGIGLYLLHYAEQMNDERARQIALKAGYRLVESAIDDSTGLRWLMMPDYPNLMPNFSHGGAGIAYFLLRLYENTGEQIFLDATLRAVQYLDGISNESGIIFHHEPGGEDLYYLGWCHGPPGTSRLYYLLWQVTGETTWKEKLLRPAEFMLGLRIPEAAQPGLWNNVGVCCGTSGLADYYLQLYRATGEARYLDFVRKLTIDLLARANPAENGVNWVHAEHRMHPELLIAQTGYMQGAAGIGIWLLQMDAYQQGRKRGISLPDSPFGE